MATAEPYAERDAAKTKITGVINNLVAEIQNTERALAKVKDKPQKFAGLVRNYNEQVQTLIHFALNGELRNNLSADYDWLKQNNIIVDNWLNSAWINAETKAKIQSAIGLIAQTQHVATSPPQKSVFIIPRSRQGDLDSDTRMLQQLEMAIASLIKHQQGTIKFLDNGTKQNPGMQIRVGFEDFNQNEQSRNNYTALKKALSQLGVDYIEKEGKEFKPMLIIRPGNIKADIRLGTNFGESLSQHYAKMLESAENTTRPKKRRP